MLSIRSILNILALGSVMVDNPVPQRMLSKTLCVIAMVIVTSMLLVTLLVSILAFIYQLMLSNGIREMDAALYTLGIIFAVTFVAGILTMGAAKKLLEVVRSNSKKPIPLTTHLSEKATNVAEAFLNGLLNRRNNSSSQNNADFY